MKMSTTDHSAVTRLSTVGIITTHNKIKCLKCFNDDYKLTKSHQTSVRHKSNKNPANLSLTHTEGIHRQQQQQQQQQKKVSRCPAGERECSERERERRPVTESPSESRERSITCQLTRHGVVELILAEGAAR